MACNAFFGGYALISSEDRAQRVHSLTEIVDIGNTIEARTNPTAHYSHTFNTVLKMNSLHSTIWLHFKISNMVNMDAIRFLGH